MVGMQVLITNLQRGCVRSIVGYIAVKLYLTLAVISPNNSFNQKTPESHGCIIFASAGAPKEDFGTSGRLSRFSAKRPCRGAM